MAKGQPIGFGAFVLGGLALVFVVAALAQVFHWKPPTAPAEDTSIPTPWLQDIAAQYAGPALHLRDPASAIYTDTTYRTRHGVAYICGFVNAKNGFGGYAGPQPFIVGGGRSDTGDSRGFDKRWLKFCVLTDASETLAKATN